MRHAVTVAVLGALLSVSTVAAADDAREESRAAFRDGVEAAQRGDYMRARGFFERAYKLFPHPSILLNRGIARAHTGDYLEAEHDLVNFLADDGGAPQNEIASARSELALVRAHLGTFRLRVVPSGARAKIDDNPVATIPGEFVEVRARTGEHSLHIEAEGYAPLDRTIDVDAAAVHELDVVLALGGRARGTGDGEGGARGDFEGDDGVAVRGERRGAGDLGDAFGVEGDRVGERLQHAEQRELSGPSDEVERGFVSNRRGRCLRRGDRVRGGGRVFFADASEGRGADGRRPGARFFRG